MIEQLKLTPEKDSFKNHAWIPEKRLALEAKLKRTGVDLTETLMWHVRGGKTRLEIDRPPKIVKMCFVAEPLLDGFGETRALWVFCVVRVRASHVTYR